MRLSKDIAVKDQEKNDSIAMSFGFYHILFKKSLDLERTPDVIIGINKH